nr:hypothetical protein [Mycobacterium lepromatosis]
MAAASTRCLSIARRTILYVIAGKRRYDVGLVNTSRFQCLGEADVPEDYRYGELVRCRQETGVHIALDHRYVISGCGQISDDVDAERA